MKMIYARAQSLFAGLLLSMAGGCTQYQSPAVQATALPTGPLLPHHVALVVDQNLTDYKHQYHDGFSTFVVSFGTPLEQYTHHVATNAFQQVDFISSVEKAVALTSADLILIPRAVKSDVSVPVNGLKDENLAFVVTWTAKDRATQNTVWLTTITAQATESKWNVNLHDGGKLYQNLFDDLSLKTFKAFQEAPELRAHP
jgi:hypothetical protein